MAKSVRSKIKRQHRREFRNTLGQAAYDKVLKQTTGRLKLQLEQQTLSSLERISAQLETDETTTSEAMVIQDNQEEAPSLPVGENKISVAKRSWKRKKYAPVRKTTVVKKERPKPKYYVEF